MRQRDSARTGQSRASTDDRRRRSGVVRSRVRRSQHQPVENLTLGQGPKREDLQGLGYSQLRQDRGQPLSQHRLPHAWWPVHEQVMPPGRSDLQHALRVILADHVDQVQRARLLSRSGRHGRLHEYGSSPQHVDHVTKSRDAPDRDALDQVGLAQLADWNDRLVEPVADCREQGREEPANRSDPAIEPQLAEQHRTPQPVVGKLMVLVSAQHSDRYTQVVVGARLGQGGGSEVDRDELVRPAQVQRRHRGPATVLALRQRRVRQPHELGAWMTATNPGLDLDHMTRQPHQGHGVNRSHCVTPLA